MTRRDASRESRSLLVLVLGLVAIGVLSVLQHRADGARTSQIVEAFCAAIAEPAGAAHA